LRLFYFLTIIVGRRHSSDHDSDETNDVATFARAQEGQIRGSISFLLVVLVDAVLHNVLSVVIVVLQHYPFFDSTNVNCSFIFVAKTLYARRISSYSTFSSLLWLVASFRLPAHSGRGHSHTTQHVLNRGHVYCLFFVIVGAYHRIGRGLCGRVAFGIQTQQRQRDWRTNKKKGTAGQHAFSSSSILLAPTRSSVVGTSEIVPISP
jgi:hypothetical protein